MGIDLKGALKTQDEIMADMFGDNNTGIRELSIADLRPYPNQPFKPYSEDKLAELTADIKDNGIISPVIVRKMKPDETSVYEYYQILAGHNRVRAGELAGLEKVPCIVKTDISDEQAQLIMVNTNLNQRDELLPSEKAFAYKMQMDAIRQQGKRTDLSSRPMVEKINSAEMVGSANNESDRQIQRYIRITYLTSDLLSMVDEKVLPFRAGVALSYLSEDEQDVIYAYIVENNISLSVQNAEDLKRYKQDIEGAVITKDILDNMFAKPVKEKKEKPCKVIISQDYIRKYFDGKNPKEIQEELETILDEYFEKRNQEENSMEVKDYD